MNLSAMLRNCSLVIALLLIWGIFSTFTDGFATAYNFKTILETLSFTAVAALGMYLIILLAHIDLSIGSAMALAAGISCVLITKSHWAAPAAMGIALLAIVAIYAGMGALVAWQGIPAFVVTLGGLLAYRGMALEVIDNRMVANQLGSQDNLLSIITTYTLPDWAAYTFVIVITLISFAWVTRRHLRAKSLGLDLNSILPFWTTPVGIGLIGLALIIALGDKGMPLCLPILIVTSLIVWFIATQSRFGRWCYAVGGNLEAAKLSGVPVKLVTVGAFTIAGALAALAGFLLAGQTGSATATTAELMELDAIAACVIGGVSLTGGRGSVIGVLLGAMLIVSLMSGLRQTNLEPHHEKIIRGAVIVVAVWLDIHFSRKKS